MKGFLTRRFDTFVFKHQTKLLHLYRNKKYKTKFLHIEVQTVML